VFGGACRLRFGMFGMVSVCSGLFSQLSLCSGVFGGIVRLVSLLSVQ